MSCDDTLSEIQCWLLSKWLNKAHESTDTDNVLVWFFFTFFLFFY